MARSPCLSVRALLALVALTVAALPSRAGDTVLYVQDREDGNGSVFAWTVGDATAGLQPIDGSAFSGPASAGGCGGFCMTMASGRRGKQQYLFTAQHEGLFVWRLLDGGALQLVDGSPFDAGLGSGNYLGVGSVRLGQRLFVYTARYTADQILGFEVLEDGSLEPTPGSPYPSGDGPTGLDVAGKLVVVCNSNDSSISSWIVQKDGSLAPAPGSPLAVPGANAYNLQLDDKGRTLWMADADSDLFGFSVHKQSGALTPLPDSPLDNGLDDGDDGTEPGQRLLITFANDAPANTPDIAVFSAHPKQGLTLLGRQISGLQGVVAHTFDERLGLLAVVSDSGPAGSSLRVYSVDRKTGAMLIVGEVEVSFEAVNDMQFVEL